MIIDQLYQSSITWGVGATANQYTDECTTEVRQLGTVSVDSYFLGWAEYDDLPTFMGHCTGSLDGDILTITEDVNESRVPCGYTFVGQVGSTDFQRGIFLKDGAWTGNSGGWNYAYLMNQVHPEYYASTVGLYTGGQIALYFLVVLYDAGNNEVNRNGYGFQHNDYSTFFPFIHGDSSIYENITLYDYAQSTTVNYGDFELTADMFADGTEMVTMLDPDTHLANGYTARLFMVGYSVPVMYVRNNGGTTDRTGASFFVKLSAGEHEYCINASGNTGLDWNLGWYGSSLGYIDLNGNYTHYENFAGVSGTVNISQIRGNEGAFTWDGGVLAVCGSWREGFPIGVFALCSLQDVRKSLDSHFRVCPGTYVDSYVLNQSYATDVTEEDQFLLQLKTGNISNPTFKDSLREWQYSDFQADDFTEEDIPVPPDPDVDPGQDDPVDTPLVTGDDQELQLTRTLATPTNFITMYNITPPMLTIFGETLWKSIVDYNPNDPTTIEVYKNFFTFINESVTGSIDIGSLLQFVVSVRQYPFNVSGINITEAAGNSIKLGTGKFPISLGSAANVQRLTSTIGILDCGEVTIANYKDFKLYNDFRDYLNTSVSAFLPYCGTVELNPIEVIHNTVHCYYAVDFYTGECTAYLTCTDGNHTWISGIKNGTIGVLIPLTATNSGQISARHQSDNARDSGLIASTMGNLFSTVANVATGNIAGAVGNIVGIAQNDAMQRQMDAERQGRSAVMAPSLSGGSGAAAFYQPSCASILVRRGTYARDKIHNYPSTCAYPATTSGLLSSFHGYTECYNVNVDTLNCNEEERAQVKMILETGVYLP